MKIAYFQESRAVKIKNKIVTEEAGRISFKEIVEMRRERGDEDEIKEKGNTEDNEDRHTELMREVDTQRLCWVLKMHSDRRMNKKP